MPYIVTNSDGSLTATVADNTVDTATYSLALVGRNVSNYGQFFAQNTIRHLENFASTAAPSPSVRLVGQLWYDKREQLLRVYDGAEWRRATNIGVGPQGSRLAEDDISLRGGEGFFNLTTNKLQVFNGTNWRDASYPGDVTSEFANNQIQDSSAQLGTRIRSLLLQDADISGLVHPVLATVYVNSHTRSSPNLPAGETTISGQQETIISIFSQTEFFIANSDPYHQELTGQGGIAGPRADALGRPVGKIFQGINLRADAEQSSLTEADTIVADLIDVGTLKTSNLGESSDPVGLAFIETLNVLNVLNVDGNVDATNVSVTNTITAPFAEFANVKINNTANVVNAEINSLVVSESTVLNNNTVINGNITVNGVNTQTIGEPGNLIEDYFGENITTANITVENIAVFTGSGLVLDASSGEAKFGDVEVLGDLSIDATTTFNGDVVFGPTANITIVDDLNVPGNVFALNVAASNNVSAQGYTGGTLSVNTVNALQINGNVSGTTASFSGNVVADKLIGDGSLITNIPGVDLLNISSNVNTSQSIVAQNIVANANVSATTGVFSGNIGAQFFVGTATQARYADLAEIYAADADYEPGTVVCIGGAAEITATAQYADTEVFGVISTDPAYLMNSGAQGLPVALQGRVPVKVIGKVHKGQRLVSAMVAGTACALIDETQYDPRTVIGRALADKDTEDAGVIEAVIGVK